MIDVLSVLREALADRYSVERELGEGGMAIVYLAQDLKHNRQVAIKVFRPEVAAQMGEERFLLEIETAASLSHPHILTVHDSGAAEGTKRPAARSSTKSLATPAERASTKSPVTLSWGSSAGGLSR